MIDKLVEQVRGAITQSGILFKGMDRQNKYVSYLAPCSNAKLAIGIDSDGSVWHDKVVALKYFIK